MVARFIDGDLTREERDGLEAHIAACTACYGLLTESTEVWWRLGSDTSEDEDSGRGEP